MMCLLIINREQTERRKHERFKGTERFNRRSENRRGGREDEERREEGYRFY